MNALTVCIFLAAALVIVGCYEVAHRMTWRTRHSMRLAIVLAGVAACLALLGESREHGRRVHATAQHLDRRLTLEGAVVAARQPHLAHAA